MTQLERLAEIEGFDDVMEMLNEASSDSVVPAICTNKNCDFTMELEPDGQNATCEICKTDTVSSCLIIAGLI